MTGCLYGIGVGPGDPELMTMKAVRRLKECRVLAIPHEDKERCVAYNIALQAVPEIGAKKILYLLMPMTKDKAVLNKNHEAAADAVAACLSAGEDVAFITLGDPSVYSTYLYVHERIQKRGYQTEIISGITSFCAAAARLNMPLVNGREQLHIIPASYDIEEALKLPGVKVLMKSGRQIARVKKQLADAAYEVRMVENCGMEQERVFHRAEEIPEDSGYYSLLIVRDKGVQ